MGIFNDANSTTTPINKQSFSLAQHHSSEGRGGRRRGGELNGDASEPGGKQEGPCHELGFEVSEVQRWRVSDEGEGCVREAVSVEVEVPVEVDDEVQAGEDKFWL
ncbi:uncharacterized protein A4U43_C10F18980 [Asparagus officinalis]|uniref:Uncharacterized protein n=1 Tax=Asparagus officinalis TaxID=4686 RepID=A0A5P1E3W9_ASPOF|nr:uncharacterized protein A4U43_C10F18980 [Asparagus officinalis]